MLYFMLCFMNIVFYIKYSSYNYIYLFKYIYIWIYL